MPGRGRGESSKLEELEKKESKRSRALAQQQAGPSSGVATESSSESSDHGEKVVRGRGGYRPQLVTIPANITNVQAEVKPMEQKIRVLANFVPLSPMKERQAIQYRVDFNPNLESESLRRQLFDRLTADTFQRNCTFDGWHDLLSGVDLPKELTFTSVHPIDPNGQIQLQIKKVGVVGSPYELIRIYNMNMKTFLKKMGFFCVSQTGAYVHPALSTSIENNSGLAVLRGYKTSANVHENDRVLMNLDSVHKLVQKRNVEEYMNEIPKRPGFIEAIKLMLAQKLVVTNYNKTVYRIENVDFDKNPMSTFPDTKNNRDISYMDYYQAKYNVRILNPQQPLLLVTHNRRPRGDEAEQNQPIYLVPELCNIAGLTDQQRSDNKLKVDLIRASQIPPADRVKQLESFLSKLHSNQDVSRILNEWGYTYEKEPVKIDARILKTEQVGVGQAGLGPAANWPKVDQSASFENLVMRGKIVKPPTSFKKMVVIISRADARNEGPILDKLKTGFDKVGLSPGSVEVVRITEGDSAHHYVQYLKNLPRDVDAALVILNRQNKERYDAVKKLASVERGLITQVVTAKLMMDERKANGASVKIGIQVAAKIGGDPWYVNLEMKGPTMICGYDTYHDTAQRGRSYGAFLASMNKTASQWYSKVDVHDHLDELSSHLAENLGHALRRFHEINKFYPAKVFIYRDGVSDGQLHQVFTVELKAIQKVIGAVSGQTKLSFIVVNKRIGARFYMANNKSYFNPPPGSVIDSVVTRKERYDFYLISQSTRNGTVTPTYYNILYDDTGLSASHQQQQAFRLCFLYYNWTGTVRVPAPCQYAHKLAFLCGEHLHGVPNSSLENNLHFL